MNENYVNTKEELIADVSESNDHKQLNKNWMTVNGHGFGRHMNFVVNEELDTIAYRGIVATREEINFYSKYGFFLHDSDCSLLMEKARKGFKENQR